jgi:hypothetical protein
VWVDLDDRKRPKSVPKLFGWATPQGWRQGLRPGQEAKRAVSDQPSNGVSSEQASKVVREIEAMADALGKRLYRGVLRNVAKVWNPAEIHDIGVMRHVLEQMQMAEGELRRLDAALNRVEPGTPVAFSAPCDSTRSTKWTVWRL